MTALLISLGPLINRSLSAAITIISGSFFLYGLAKDIRNRVARNFSALLFFVTVTYVGDLGVSYSGSLSAAESWLRFQWLGIAFVPAAYVHLSDAILTMTGLPSRGRRRWAVRLLYLIAVISLVLVLWTDWVVRHPLAEPAPHFQPGPVFGLFIIYFFGSFVLSMWFVTRAHHRTLTRATRTRMTQLLFTYPAPALSVFPFLLVSGPSLSAPIVFYGVLILVDAALSVMLTYMAYLMAFFGTLLPDRLVKAQMLQFFLRGPVVAIATLAVIVWVPRASGILGLPGDEVMLFLVVAEILFLQWGITLARPLLERRLIYTGDQAEIQRIQELEDRLLTGADFYQLIDAILASTCDYLQVEAAFVASLTTGPPRLERAVGLKEELYTELEGAAELPTEAINGNLRRPEDITLEGDIFIWQDFWLIPLRFYPDSSDIAPQLIGLFGVADPTASGERSFAQEERHVLMTLANRATEVLEDRLLQSEVFAALEGLLPEMAAMQELRGAARYGGVQALVAPREDVLSSPEFQKKVKDALVHYWGGPKLTDSELMNLTVVRQAMEEQDGNPQRAMRTVLQRAVERLRPEGQRNMTTTEWILYNILEMRFIQGRKVRDVAMRLAMSESDLYRKQRIAIESVAATIAEMERATTEHSNAAQ